MHLGALLVVLPLAAATVSFEGNVPSVLAIGQSATIKWTSSSEPVKVLLMGGNDYALIDIICNAWITNDVSKACTSDDGEIKWTPKNDVPLGRYSLQARDADNQQASSNFISIVAEGQGPSSTTTSSTTRPTSGSSTSTTTGASTGTAGSSPTSATTGPAASSTGTNSGASAADDSTGLSTGAKAGIGAGAAVGGIVLLGLLGFLVFRMGKKAAAKKNNKDDGSGVEEGDVSADGDKVAAAGAVGSNEDDKKDEKDLGPAEMAAPEFIHEAPDYKTRLDSPGGNAFFSELDATGGSFVIPSSRPSTAAGLTEAGTAANTTSSPTDAERPETPKITITAPEGEKGDKASSSPLKEQAESATVPESTTAATSATTSESAENTPKTEGGLVDTLSKKKEEDK